ncbi:hypothetical protein BDN72DRAFT_593760 [Pluteus cervinus]|uniref:Uncharacterized protein n=1 Tax=Pluteus cervinus TaxID=181527 RepID=A0ACD3A1T2_9AGAR|nr:hypothetical protein BDN72DRAFT_593760 [Pluteus cervinus]
MVKIPPVELMAGPSMLGCTLNWFLFGCLCVQTYDYHQLFYKGDRLGIKILVYAVFVIELISTALVTNTSFTVVIVRWGSPNAFDHCPDTSPPTVALNVIIATIVQFFFAWRVWCMRKDIFGKITVFLITSISLVSLVSGLIFVYKYRRIHQEYDKLVTLSAFMETWLSATFVCDFIIAAAMVAILKMAGTSITFTRTKTILNHLIVHTIETGSFTALVALSELLLFYLYPATYLHLVQLYMLGRLYSNVLVASLNGRHRMRSLMSDSYESACVGTLQIQPTTMSLSFTSGATSATKAISEGSSNVNKRLVAAAEDLNEDKLKTTGTISMSVLVRIEHDEESLSGSSTERVPSRDSEP